MTMQNDAEYYRRRAEQAHAHAAAATLPEVRCVHVEMAERYRMLQQEAESDTGHVRRDMGIVPHG